MNVRDTPYHGETLVTRAKHSMAMSKDKKAVTLTQGYVKTSFWDHECTKHIV